MSQAEVAPWLVAALFAIAGMGVLHAVGVVERSLRGVLAGLGLAYLAGVAVVSSLLVTALVVGIPFSFLTFAVAVLAACLTGVLVGERRFHRRSPAAGTRPATGVDQAVLVTFGFVFGCYAIVGLHAASALPLDEWDAWSIWTRKALILTHFDSLPLGFFGSDSYKFMHQDYPLLLPVFEAIHFRAMGEADTQAIHAQLWILLIAFVWAMAFLASRITRPVVWAPVLLLVAVAPAVTNQLLSGYADVPTAIFFTPGVLAAGIWMAQGDRGCLALSVVLLAGAANTKNEGLMAATATLAVIGVLLVASRDRRSARPFLIAASALLATVLPWQLWLVANGISGDISLSQGLNPGFLSDHADRAWPAVKALYAQITDQTSWLYLLPLGLAAGLAALLTRRRRLALFYLGTGALLFTLLVWGYLVRPDDLSWLLATSANRVVTLVMFLTVPAMLQLAAELDSRLARVDAECGADGAPVGGQRKPQGTQATSPAQE